MAIPDDCLQSLVNPWWIEDEGKTLCRGSALARTSRTRLQTSALSLTAAERGLRMQAPRSLWVASSASSLRDAARSATGVAPPQARGQVVFLLLNEDEDAS